MTNEKKEAELESIARSILETTRAQLRTVRWLVAWVGKQLGRRLDRKDPSVQRPTPSERWGA